MSFILFSLVDAVYAMAHSLHNLVLDECCTRSKDYHSKEEALKVCTIYNEFAFWSKGWLLSNFKQILGF